jgi:hypothetical protein
MEPNNPAPPPHPSQDSSQQTTSFLAFGTIHTIIGGSNLTFENKRQKEEHYRQVNHVAIEGPNIRTKWLHVQITLTKANIKLTSFPHADAMVITAYIDKWNVTRLLVDNGSQAEILFLSSFEHMGFNTKQLKEASKPQYGFSGKKIEPVGSISLPVSFGTLANARTECITFDVVDMSYSYSTIFGKRFTQHLQSSTSFTLSLSENTSNLGGHFSSRQPKRCNKYRAGFCSRPQKCKLSVG